MNDDYKPLTTEEKDRILNDVAQYFKDLTNTQKTQKNKE